MSIFHSVFVDGVPRTKGQSVAISRQDLAELMHHAPLFFSTFYKDKNICKFSETDVRIYLETDFDDEEDIQYVDVDDVSILWEKSAQFNVKIIQKIKKCMSDTLINIIILPFAIGYLKNRKSYMTHACILFIDKSHKSVELYDPNGSYDHSLWFKDMDYVYFKNFNILGKICAGYKWSKQVDSCPPDGFQMFQEEENSNITDGLCIAWSIYIAHLRIVYSNLNQREFRAMLGEMTRTPLGLYFFSEFITDYISYMLARLTDSVKT